MAETTERRLKVYAGIAFAVAVSTLAWHGYLKPSLGEPTLPPQTRAEVGAMACASGWDALARSAYRADEPLADAVYFCTSTGAKLMHVSDPSYYASLYQQKQYIAYTVRRLENGWLYMR